jgi:hypothetical protein
MRQTSPCSLHHFVATLLNEPPTPGVGLGRAVAIHRNHLITGGETEIPDLGLVRVIRQSVASGSARAISGVEYETADPEMADHVVEVRVRAINFGSATDPRFGLLARFRDTANFTFVTLHRNGRIVLGSSMAGVNRFSPAHRRTLRPERGTGCVSRPSTTGYASISTAQ